MGKINNYNGKYPKLRQFTVYNLNTGGECKLKHDGETPVLGGKEIRLETYPQHGSIQLEKLPLSTDSVIWNRGDSISRSGAQNPKKKLKVTGNPKSVSICSS